MKPLHILIAAALLAGCQDDTPTGVTTSVEPPPAVAATARVAIADVVDRIVPQLSDGAGPQPLAGAMRRLRQALSAGHTADGPALARAAQAEVERYARLEGGDAAELDAIRLALAVVVP